MAQAVRSTERFIVRPMPYPESSTPMASLLIRLSMPAVAGRLAPAPRTMACLQPALP
jgi:hypothetical protein